MAQVVAILRSEQFETLECYKCGVVFAVSVSLVRQWRESTDSFFCPNGHAQAFVESEADRLRRQIAKLKETTAAQIADEKRATEWERVRSSNLYKQVVAKKGQITKLRKRVGHGVCPCCQRTFQQLARHMAHKHPEFKQPEPDVEVGA